MRLTTTAGAPAPTHSPRGGCAPSLKTRLAGGFISLSTPKLAIFALFCIATMASGCSSADLAAPVPEGEPELPTMPEPHVPVVWTPGGVEDPWAIDLSACADGDDTRCLSGDLVLQDADSTWIDRPDLEVVLGSVIVRSNDHVRWIELPALRFVGGDVVIQSNRLVEALDGLAGLEVVAKDLVVQANERLTDIRGLDALRAVGGTLDLFGNDALADAPFAGLRDIGGSLIVHHNDALADLAGFHALETIGQSLSIDESFHLEQISGFGHLVSIGQDLVINRTTLQSLDGLRFLDHVGGQLALRENVSLKTIAALSNLRHVGGSMTLFDNRKLTSLDGLHRLAHIGQILTLEWNDNLRALDLPALTHVSGLVVKDNLLLPECDLRDWLDALIAAGFEGDAVIEGNAPCQ